MTPAYRRELLSLLAKTEQLIAGFEAVIADPASDEELLIASKEWRDMREVVAKIERKLNNPEINK